MTFIFPNKWTHLECTVTCKSQVLSVLCPHSEFCLSELSPLYALPIRNKQTDGGPNFSTEKSVDYCRAAISTHRTENDRNVIWRKINIHKADEEDRNKKKGLWGWTETCDEEGLCELDGTVDIGGILYLNTKINPAMKLTGTTPNLEYTQYSAESEHLNNMMVIPLQTNATGTMKIH